jgi:hypothetical protein
MAFLLARFLVLAPFGYTQFTDTGLLATGSSTELDFGFIGANFGPWYLDDVSVTPARVLEPLSTLWLALPFAGMVAFRRFRTKSV